MTPRWLWTAFSLVVALLLAGCSETSDAQSDLIIEPGEDVPFYARWLKGDEWTAIVFYRPPECVPEDFSLLSFFDIPRAFDCGPPTTEGFAVREDSPEVNAAPLLTTLQGRGQVPIWFVQTREWDDAVAGGNQVDALRCRTIGTGCSITVGQLEAISSRIVGTADSFLEVLEPIQAVPETKYVLVASGTLADGRSFELHVIEEGTRDAIIREQMQLVFE